MPIHELETIQVHAPDPQTALKIFVSMAQNNSDPKSGLIRQFLLQFIRDGDDCITFSNRAIYDIYRPICDEFEQNAIARAGPDNILEFMSRHMDALITIIQYTIDSRGSIWLRIIPIDQQITVTKSARRIT
jgi:hypothetical protein